MKNQSPARREEKAVALAMLFVLSVSCLVGGMKATALFFTLPLDGTGSVLLNAPLAILAYASGIAFLRVGMSLCGK